MSTQLISICVSTCHFLDLWCIVTSKTRMYFISPLWVYFLVFLFSVKCSSAKEYKTLEERTLARINIKSNLLLYSRFATGRILFCSLLNDRLLFITNVHYPEVFEVNKSALGARDLSLEGVKPQSLKTKFPALYDSLEFSQMISTRNWSSINYRSVAINFGDVDKQETLIFVRNCTPDPRSDALIHLDAIVFSLTLNQTSFRDYQVSFYNFNYTQSHFISSTEPNVFYNFLTVAWFESYVEWLEKYKYNFNDKMFVKSITYQVCKHSQANEDGLETIAFLDRDNRTSLCERLDWSDLWHYDGFTDMKHFYLFGRRNLVYIIEHPENFDNWTIMHTAKRIKVSMKDFFKVNRTQLTPGHSLTTPTTSTTQDILPRTTPYRFLTDFRVEMIRLAVFCIGLTTNLVIVFICHQNRFCILHYLGGLFGVDHPSGGL